MQHDQEQAFLFGLIDREILNKGNRQPQENKKTGGRQNHASGTQDKGKNSEEAPKVTSTTCKPVATERPRIELPGHKVDARIEFMRDHAIIWKFIGLWPTKRALYGWIAAKWKPKGDVTLQLGPKGFFTVILYCIEDKLRVLGTGPHFFNAAGLYMRDWIPRFNPDKEDLTWAPVWIRMYGLPDEYWDEDVFRKIGNGLG